MHFSGKQNGAMTASTPLATWRHSISALDKGPVGSTVHRATRGSCSGNMVSFLEFFCDSSRAVSTTHHRLQQHWMNYLIEDSGRKYRVKYSSFSSTSNRCARACKYSAHFSQWHPASILLNVKGSSDLSQAARKSIHPVSVSRPSRDPVCFWLSMWAEAKLSWELSPLPDT